jgi:hypothetical protein
VDDDQQRRLDALHRLAQEQLRAQQAAKETPSQERDDSALLVEPLAPGEKKSTSASTRLSRGHRRGLIWTLIGGVAVLAVVFTGVVARGRIQTTATPTPTPSPENALIVTSNFTSGTVSVNGKKLTGTVPLLVRLNPGENTITYSAPPFHDRTCSVTLLPQPDPRSGQRAQGIGDGCGIGNQEPAITFQGVLVSNGYLVFGLTGADLPNDLRNAAESALWLKLTNLSALQVPAGDYYATGATSAGRITSARAAVPLLAIPALARTNSTQDGPSCGNLGCAGRAILPDQNGAAPATGTWLIQESVASGWRFTTQSGALISTSAFRDSGVVQTGLTYSSTAGWAISVDAPGPFTSGLQTQILVGSCQSGTTVLQGLIDKSPLAGQQLSLSSSNASFGPAQLQTDGCALTAEVGANNPLNPTGGNKRYGQYIWRWGVLLAADAQARALFPSLPVAPQSEIDAVGGFGL